MMQILDLCVIIFTVSFIENAVFSYGFAVDGIDRIPTDKKSFIPFSVLFLLSTTLLGVVSFVFDKYVFGGRDALRIVILPITSFLLMLGILYLTSRFFKKTYRKIKPFCDVLLLNTATVGIVYTVCVKELGIVETVLYTAAAAVGALLSYVIFADVTERIIEKRMPPAFRGLSGLLIAIGLIMMVFSGIRGIDFFSIPR